MSSTRRSRSVDSQERSRSRPRRFQPFPRPIDRRRDRDIRFLAQRIITERTESQVRELNPVGRLLTEFSTVYNSMLQAYRDSYLLYDLPYGILGVLRTLLIVLLDAYNRARMDSD